MKNAGLIALLTVLLVASTALGASQVTNVRLSYSEGQTVAYIDVAGGVRFAHQTEVAKDGRPYRVIVDVLSAVHELGGKTFESVPKCIVSGVRTSQYSVQPEKTVRVVFDMTGETVYQITATDKAVRVTFPDPTTKAFAEWCTRDVVLAAQAKKHSRGFVAADVSEQTVPAPKAIKTAGELNKALDQDRMASLADSKSADKVPKKVIKQTSSAVPSGSARKFSAMDRYEQPAATPPVVAETQKPVVAEKTLAKPISKPTPKVTPAPVQLAAVDVTPEQAPAKPIIEKVAKPKPKAPVATPKQPVVVKSEPKAPVVVKSEPKAPAAVKSEPKAPLKVEPQVEKKSKPTSRFRRSPVQSNKIKGSLVAEFPKRLVIKYNRGGRRDPFETLINEARVYDSPMAERIPNVEGLRLVGVIESAAGENSALFEDGDSYSYILRAGDKVRRGYVLRVERDRVFFQIFEYGWSRTVALNIEN